MGIQWPEFFSENIRDFGGYTIGKLLTLLDDPEIISLAGGLPSPDTFLKQELQAASQKHLASDISQIMQYTAVHGEQSLINAIIAFMKQDNIHLEAENLLITSSGQHGLDITGRLFLDPGDRIILDRPSFGGAIVAFQMQRPRFVGVNIEQDGSDISGFEASLKTLKAEGKQAKFIYVVPDFQNPSGITMCLPKREALLDLSYAYDVPVIEDTPYRSLRYHGKDLPSLTELDQKRDGTHVLGVYTFSKLFCPGIRVGYCTGPKEVIEKMKNIKEGNLLNTPKYNQDMCTAFLTEMNIADHLRKCRAYYREKLDLFLEMMKSCFPASWGVTWTRPEGGLFIWVTLPDHIDTTELLYDAIKFKVAFVPGECFFGENAEKNHMRINFSYPSMEQLSEAAKRLAKCVEKRL